MSDIGSLLHLAIITILGLLARFKHPLITLFADRNTRGKLPAARNTPHSTRPGNILHMDHYLPDPDMASSSKRRKLGPSESFADVLAGFEAAASWRRPDYTPSPRLIFQQIDIQPIPDSSALHVFGVTQSGNSVLAHITNFSPYFYIAAPRGFTANHLLPFIESLNVRRLVSLSHLPQNLAAPGAPVKTASLVKKRPLQGYLSHDWVLFIKITCSTPENVTFIKGKLEAGLFDYEGLFDEPVKTYETDIEYVLRFMIDTKVVGMNWIEIPPGKYNVITGDDKVSHCQLELSVKYTDVISHPPTTFPQIAPLRILSIDIECTPRRRVVGGKEVWDFPVPEKDPTIQIANMVTRYGDTTPFIRTIFTLNTCDPIPGSQVLSFPSEPTLLLKWHEFLREVDPDVIIGFNMAGFDIPYLVKRAYVLGIGEGFGVFGRLKDTPSTSHPIHFWSSKYGRRPSKETLLPGRLQLDLLRYILREHHTDPLQKHKLNEVCKHFLGEGERKEDVGFEIIAGLQGGTSEERKRLAVYCMKDAYLPQRLLDKTNDFVKYVEISRVTGVPFNLLFAHGQSIKILPRLFSRANNEGYILPALRKKGEDEDKFHFPNLYVELPHGSIMKEFNLCYSTLVDRSVVERLGLVKDEDYIQLSDNALFVKPSLRSGIIPSLLADIQTETQDITNQLEPEKDGSSIMSVMLNSRKDALTMCANFLYALPGAYYGRLSCPALSRAVWAYHKAQQAQPQPQPET